jgi:hypothetical protein
MDESQEHLNIDDTIAEVEAELARDATAQPKE